MGVGHWRCVRCDEGQQCPDNHQGEPKSECTLRSPTSPESLLRGDAPVQGVISSVTIAMSRSTSSYVASGFMNVNFSAARPLISVRPSTISPRASRRC